MARLTLIKSYSKMNVDLVDECDLIFGRASDCDVICYQNSGISRKHCRIQHHKVENSFFVTDLDSVNGTFVNGVQISATTRLDGGDELSLGELIYFLFEENSEDFSEATLELPPHTETRRFGKFDFEENEQIGHFRITKQVGAGAMSSVYLAVDEILLRKVALKFLAPQNGRISGDEKRREQDKRRFVREAQSAAVINHTNIAQIYEANFSEGMWFIAMEYINGVSLGEKLKNNGVIALCDVVNIAYQIMDGLEHAWDRHRILHRDIKPQNIMLNNSNEVKIVDFGLAKVISKFLKNSNNDETTAGMPIGTPHYMAPEQSIGSTELDQKADIYALGVTLYELLTGKKAFDNPSEASIYKAKLSNDYAPLSLLRPEIPEKFEKLIQRMLLPVVEDRISDYEEVRHNLRGLDRIP